MRLTYRYGKRITEADFGHRQFDGALIDRSRFSTEDGYVSSWSDDGRVVDVVATSSRWRFDVANRAPRLWYGRLNGVAAKDLHSRNVHINYGDEGGAWIALRLEGAYTYYLVGRVDTSDVYWIIDTGDGSAPDRMLVFSDFLALQFVLGRPLCVYRLVGTDEYCRFAGLLGGQYGMDVPRRAGFAEPIPLKTAPSQTFVAPFFRKLCDAYRRQPDWRLYVPLSYYVQSLKNYIDGGYLHLHVALEAFAGLLLKADGDGTRIIADEAAWKSWVREHRSDIEKFAVSGMENSLMSKLNKECLRASGQTVRRAFERYGIELTPEMKKELAEGRNLVAHTAEMSGDKPDERDFAEDRERMQIVRTMITALLAKAVGYQGPILFWEQDERRWYKQAPLSWWPIGAVDADEAGIFYDGALDRRAR